MEIMAGWQPAGAGVYVRARVPVCVVCILCYVLSLVSLDSSARTSALISVRTLTSPRATFPFTIYPHLPHP